MQFPAAIMERSPAPGIARLPVPPGVAVDPVTPVAVRAPAMVNHHHAGLPAPAVTVQLNPGAVGGEIVVKISDVRRRAADVSRGRCFRGWGWGGGYRRFGWGRGHWLRRDGARVCRGIEFLVVSVGLTLPLQIMIPIQHRRDDRRGETDIPQVENV